MNSRCLTPAELESILRGDPSAPTPPDWVSHLDGCRGCRQQLEALAGAPPGLPTSVRPIENLPISLSPALQDVISDLITSARGKPPEPIPAPGLDELKPFFEPATNSHALGRVGEFEVLGLLGSGGMGIVLDGFDTRLHRPVAIKVLAPALAATPSGRERFLREARSAAAVFHPNIVTIHAVGESRGLPYIAMERVEGSSLAAHLATESRLPPERVLDVARDVASGLAAAHAAGIIHRDIKPANVLLNARTGQAKITDFGLARCGEEVGLTRTGFVAGTPEYLSPEHATGQPVGPASDLFGLGCLLYALATGHSPFQAPTALAALRRVLEDPPVPLHLTAPQFPCWFSHLVDRLLAKSPAERPASAIEVLALLQSANPRPNVHPPTVHTALRYAIILFSLIALAATMFYSLRKLGPSASTPSAGRAAPNERESLPLLVMDREGKRVGAFQTIGEALDALPESGILELNWDGPREWPELELPRRPLRIQSSASRRPVWHTTNAIRQSFLVSAPLHLEGVEIRASISPSLLSTPRLLRRPLPFQPPRTYSALRVHDTILTLRNCIVRIESAPPAMARTASSVTLYRNAEATCENCALIAPTGRSFVLNEGDERREREFPSNPGTVSMAVTLSNCVLRAAEGIHLENTAAIRADVQVIQTTLRCDSFLEIATLRSNAILEVECTRTVVQCRDLLRDRRGPIEPRLSQVARWRDSSNVYFVGGSFLRTQSESDTSITDLFGWNQCWGQSDTATLRGWRPVFTLDPRVPNPNPNPDPAPVPFPQFELRTFDDVRNRRVPRATWVGRGANLLSLPRHPPPP